jgi:hypothetical protein
METRRLRFDERQHLRTWWVLGLVLVVVALSWWAFVEQIVFGRPFGNRPASDAAVWALTLGFGLGLPLFIGVLSLRTTVDGDELVLHWRPFRRRRIALADIASARAVHYRPIRDYGGWGLRYGRGGWCYSMSGDRGVMLELRDGRRLLVGSWRAEELAEVLGRP